MLCLNRLTPQNTVLRAPFDMGRGPISASNQGAEKAPLGSIAKSVRHFSRKSLKNNKNRENKSARFRHQRFAKDLPGAPARLAHCRWSVISKQAGVELVTSTYEEGGQNYAHFEGLQTCGSVWTCPCCSARISETRRDELNQLLSWARSEGYSVQMITLTARHGRDDDLANLLDRMKDAKQRWARHRTYTRIKENMIGSVTATEVTGGGVHGWHPHFHMIVVLDGDVDLEQLRGAWLASLRGAGLDGAGAAFQAQNADAAGNYIAKWGAAEELALSGRKKGRAGRTPAQLLADACDEGDRQAGRLWSEYAEVFHGRRQLVWSRGLKDLAGVGEIDDEEAARDQQQDGQQEEARANIPHDVWRREVASRGADRRAELLDRAEEIGPEAAVAEIEAGYEPEELIEEEPQRWTPRPGGLAAMAIAAVQPPLRQGP